MTWTSRTCGLAIRCGLILSAALLATDALAESPADQPNIVLIISDYMGYHDIEPYGADDVRTPQLSRLASEGVNGAIFILRRRFADRHVQRFTPDSIQPGLVSRKIFAARPMV